MRFFFNLVIAFALAVAGGVRAGVPAAEELQDFADKLYADGDDTFALLEYKRLLFHYPNADNAADLMLNVALLEITVRTDIPAAVAFLADIQDRYPETQAAQRASSLQTFISRHGTQDNRALALFLRARSEEQRGHYAEAIDNYLAVQSQRPNASLADDALLSAAKLELDKREQPEAAQEHLNLFEQTYPRSPLSGHRGRNRDMDSRPRSRL